MTQTQEVTVKMIHDDFLGAEERLFVDSIGLKKNPQVSKVLYAERFHKIGFGKSKAPKEAADIVERRKDAGKTIEAIEYFWVHYPNNKFITEKEVKRLCEKYGLLFGDAENYTGDIPEQNLVAIEKFKLRKEDFQEPGYGKYTSSWIQGFTGFIPSMRRRPIISDFDAMQNIMYSAFLDEPANIPPQPKKQKPAFKICAPKSDFDTSGFIVVDGYKLVYDPIVLQPVMYNGIEGHLLVTMWGEEASDKDLVNEVMN